MGLLTCRFLMARLQCCLGTASASMRAVTRLYTPPSTDRMLPADNCAEDTRKAKSAKIRNLAIFSVGIPNG